jgi:hypothetical protein
MTARPLPPYNPVMLVAARLIQLGILFAILAADLYFVSTGAVRPSLVVAQIMMILTVGILRFARSHR